MAWLWLLRVSPLMWKQPPMQTSRLRTVYPVKRGGPGDTSAGCKLHHFPLHLLAKAGHVIKPGSNGVSEEAAEQQAGWVRGR